LARGGLSTGKLGLKGSNQGMTSVMPSKAAGSAGFSRCAVSSA